MFRLRVEKLPFANLAYDCYSKNKFTYTVYSIYSIQTILNKEVDLSNQIIESLDDQSPRMCCHFHVEIERMLIVVLEIMLA